MVKGRGRICTADSFCCSGEAIYWDWVSMKFSPLQGKPPLHGQLSLLPRAFLLAPRVQTSMKMRCPVATLKKPQLSGALAAPSRSLGVRTSLYFHPGPLSCLILPPARKVTPSLTSLNSRCGQTQTGCGKGCHFQALHTILLTLRPHL